VTLLQKISLSRTLALPRLHGRAAKAVGSSDPTGPTPTTRPSGSSRKGSSAPSPGSPTSKPPSTSSAGWRITTPQERRAGLSWWRCTRSRSGTTTSRAIGLTASARTVVARRTKFWGGSPEYATVKRTSSAPSSPAASRESWIRWGTLRSGAGSSTERKRSQATKQLCGLSPRP
jgi:hypothetical protein